MNWLSNEEEELKRILDAHEFSFNEDHWLVAKKNLARKILIRRFLRGAYIMAIIVAIAFGLWLYTGNKKTGATQTAQTKTQQTGGGKNPGNAYTPNLSGNPNDDKTIAGNKNSTAQNSGMANTTGTTNEKTNLKQGENNLNPNPSKKLTYKPNSTKTNLPETETGEITGQKEATTYGSTGQDTKAEPPVLTENETQKPGETGETGLPETNEGELIAAEGDKTDTADDTALLPAPTEKTKAEKTTQTNRRILVKNTLSAMVGANYNGLLNMHASFFASPYAAVLYHRNINTSWQLSAGLGYAHVNTGGLEKEFISKQHSFGVDEEKTIITTNRLHYIEMPLFARHIGKKYNLLAGINMGYLVTTNNTIQQVTASSLKTVTTGAAKSARDYRNGINPLDVQLMFGIERRILNRWNIGLVANSGLFDVGKDTYYNKANFERNMRVQIYVRYEFWRFKKN